MGKKIRKIQKRKMKDKDKVILVCYVSAKGQDNINQICANIEEHLNSTFNDGTVKAMVIPNLSNEFGIKVECINPVLLNEEQYKKVEDIIKEFEEKTKKIFEK